MGGWVVGVVMNVFGSVAINLGTNMMKLGHTQSEAAAAKAALAAKEGGGDGVVAATAPPAKPQKSKTWYVGVTIFVLGSIVNFVSFGFAPQSLLAALGSVQFLSNVFFGGVILKETVTLRTYLATVAIILGNILVVLFSAKGSPEHTADDLWNFYNTTYKVYIVFLILLLGALHLLYKYYRKMQKANTPLNGTLSVLPLLYAINSALIGTQSVLQAKCLSTLLRITFDGENQLVYPFSYGIIFAWLLSTCFWMYRMNRALAKFDGLFIIPVLQVCWTLLSIIGGGIYFQEFYTFTAWQTVGFIAGVATIVFGVYLLAPKPKDGTFVEMTEAEGADRQRQMQRRSSRAESIADFHQIPHGRTRLVSVSFMPMVTSDDAFVDFVDTLGAHTREGLDSEGLPMVNADGQVMGRNPLQSTAEEGQLELASTGEAAGARV